MTEESGGQPKADRTSPKVRKVLSYRVLVKHLCRALLELADSGNISLDTRAFLKEGSRGA